MCALYHPALNGRKASDWLRPVPCQWEGDKLSKGPYQSSNGYSTGVHLPGHLACDPPSRREASHVSSQGKEAVFVTHDTLPQVVKASILYYKNKNIFTIITDKLTSTAALRVDKSKKPPPYDYVIG